MHAYTLTLRPAGSPVVQSVEKGVAGKVDADEWQRTADSKLSRRERVLLKLCHLLWAARED